MYQVHDLRHMCDAVLYSLYLLLMLLLCCRDKFDYLEDFPTNLLHELPERTGHKVTRLIVIVLDYGATYSGPGKDVFRLDRAVGDPDDAHKSNFFHPIFYYYETLPTGKGTSSRVLQYALTPYPPIIRLKIKLTHLHKSTKDKTN